MNNILVSVDFTKHSTNAASYAAALAKNTGARLILFHAYCPVELTEQELNEEAEESERSVQDKLDALAGKLQVQEAISVTRLLKPGNVVDETLYVAKKINANLIVLGVEESTEKYLPVLDESIKAMLTKNTLPLLLVPSAATSELSKQVYLVLEKTLEEHIITNFRLQSKLVYSFRPIQLLNPEYEPAAQG